MPRRLGGCALAALLCVVPAASGCRAASGPDESRRGSLVLTPEFSSVTTGETLQFAVAVRQARSTELNESFTLSSSAPLVLDIVIGLRGVAGTTGRATIRAASDSEAADSALVIVGPVPVDSVVAGGHFSCGLLAAAIFCWGDDHDGALGDGAHSGQRSVALPVLVASHERFRAVAAGGRFACGLTTKGAVRCWGFGDYGQLGIGRMGELVRSDAPANVASAIGFVALSAGDFHACALSQQHDAYCWGWNQSGAIGNGRAGFEEFALEPTLVQFRGKWKMVDAGGSSCGLAADGTAYCWGRNDFGQLGNATAQMSPTPARVVSPEPLASVSVGSLHSCAVTETGRALCWGSNVYGQIGQAPEVISMTDVPLYVEIPEPISALTTGAMHTCALAVAGAVYCWGSDWRGQVGDGSEYGRWTQRAQKVTGDRSFVAVAAGREHTCAVSTERLVFCWGANGEHQAGSPQGDVLVQPTLALSPW